MRHPDSGPPRRTRPGRSSRCAGRSRSRARGCSCHAPRACPRCRAAWRLAAAGTGARPCRRRAGRRRRPGPATTQTARIPARWPPAGRAAERRHGIARATARSARPSPRVPVHDRGGSSPWPRVPALALPAGHATRGSTRAVAESRTPRPRRSQRGIWPPWPAGRASGRRRIPSRWRRTVRWSSAWPARTYSARDATSGPADAFRAACPTPTPCRRGARPRRGPLGARTRRRNGTARSERSLQRGRASCDLHRPAHARREVVLEQGRELAQEVAEVSRQGAVRPPPGEPLERLIQGHAGELFPKRRLLDAPAGLRLILLAVRAPHGVALVAGPLARGEAHEVERAGAEGRRLPIDDGHLGTLLAAAQQDVLAEVLSVEHALRQGAEPLDAVREALEAARHEVVLRPVEAGQKACLCVGQAARRRMEARGPAGGGRPAGHVEVVVQHRPPAVLEEGPEAAALGLPAVSVQMQRPEPLRREDGFVHLQLPPTGLEVEGPHGPRLLHLMVRIEILEEHEQRSPLALESDAQAFSGKTGAPHREPAMELLNPYGPAPEPRQPRLECLANRGGEPLVDRSRLDRPSSLSRRCGARRRPRDAHVPLPARCFKSVIAPPSRRTSCAPSDGRETTGAPGNRRAVRVTNAPHGARWGSHGSACRGTRRRGRD